MEVFFVNFCGGLLCLFRPFCIFERCLDSSLTSRIPALFSFLSVFSLKGFLYIFLSARMCWLWYSFDRLSQVGYLHFFPFSLFSFLKIFLEIFVVGSFAYVAHFVFLGDVWIQIQRASVGSRRATILATHLPNWATHLPKLSHPSS